MNDHTEVKLTLGEGCLELILFFHNFWKLHGVGVFGIAHQPLILGQIIATYFRRVVTLEMVVKSKGPVPPFNSGLGITLR